MRHVARPCVERVPGQVLASGTVSLANGFFYADALSALVILLSASVALVCATYSIGYLRDDEQSGVLGDDPSGGLFTIRSSRAITDSGGTLSPGTLAPFRSKWLVHVRRTNRSLVTHNKCWFLRAAHLLRSVLA